MYFYYNLSKNRKYSVKNRNINNTNIIHKKKNFISKFNIYYKKNFVYLYISEEKNNIIKKINFSIYKNNIEIKNKKTFYKFYIVNLLFL